MFSKKKYVPLILMFLFLIACMLFYFNRGGKYVPSPVLLNNSDIETLEKFLQVEFPKETINLKSYFYYDSIHVLLFSIAEMSYENSEIMKKHLEVLEYKSIPSSELDFLDGLFSFYEIESFEKKKWSRPNKNNISLALTKYGKKEDVILFEHIQDTDRVYLLKFGTRWDFPLIILDVFPNMPGWDFRESKSYPKKAN